MMEGLSWLENVFHGKDRHRQDWDCIDNQLHDIIIFASIKDGLAYYDSSFIYAAKSTRLLPSIFN